MTNRYQGVFLSWGTDGQPKSCFHSGWLNASVSSSLRSAVTPGQLARSCPWVPLPLPLGAFVRGRCWCCSALLMWQQSERPTHTLTPFQQECDWKQNPEAAFHALFFFFLPFAWWVKVVGGIQSWEGNRQGVETPPIGQKHGWGTQWALPFHFQHSRVHVTGKGNGGREAWKHAWNMCSCTRPALPLLHWQHRECLGEGGCRDTQRWLVH